MNQDSQVTTDTQESWVNKTDVGTSSRQYFLDENSQEAVFSAPVIRNNYRIPDVKTAISDVCKHTPYYIMPEAAKTTGVK